MATGDELHATTGLRAAAVGAIMLAVGGWLEPLASAELHQVDTEGGHHNAIAIGSDGLPIIGYAGSQPVELRVAHCADRACASASVTVLDEDPASGISIAIGADDLAVVVYHQTSALKLARCDDVACTEGGAVWVDPAPAGAIDTETAVVMGADGFPVISYRDGTHRALWVADCQTAICVAATRTPVDTSPGENDASWDRRFSSIVVGDDDLPLISFYDGDSQPSRLMVAHCDDASCSSAAVTPHGIEGNEVGYSSAIALGADGFAVVSYFEAILDGPTPYFVLRLLRCLDATCATASSEVVDELPSAFLVDTDVVVGPDGLPKVSYWDFVTGALKLARCLDASCTDARISVLTTGVVKGGDLSMAVDGLGQPVISFSAGSDDELWVAYPGIHSDGFEGGDLAAWEVSP
jgi:hypothetical protein